MTKKVEEKERTKMKKLKEFTQWSVKNGVFYIVSLSYLLISIFYIFLSIYFLEFTKYNWFYYFADFMTHNPFLLYIGWIPPILLYIGLFINHTKNIIAEKRGIAK